MKIILVTGGFGFLGKALVRQLEQENYRVVPLGSKQCDLSHPESLSTLLPIEADFVFHLAGKTRAASPLEYYLANLDTTRSVLEYCRIRHVPLHFVSSYVYGKQKEEPTSEETVPHPVHPYAHSKWLAEELCLFYSRFFSLPITISRPFNIYGPEQNLTFFIPQMIHQLRTQNQIRLRTFDAKRDYVFVDDAASALIALMKKGKPGHIYNIGTGSAISCKEVVEQLQEITGCFQPLVLEEPAEETSYSQADIGKISRQTDWKPSYSFREGLLRCLS